MVRENMRSPRAELRINRLRKKLQGLVSGFDSRLATGFGFWGISSNGRAVASHATGKGIDAPILHPVSSRGRPKSEKAWLAQSVERTTLNRVVAGSSPASGARISVSVPRSGLGRRGKNRAKGGRVYYDGWNDRTYERMPGRPGFESRRGRRGRERRARRHVVSSQPIPLRPS